MNSSLLLKGGLAVLLAAAVLLKVQSRGSTEATPVDFNGQVVRLLSERGFTVVRSVGGFFPTVEARAGACSLLVGQMAPQGWHWDALRRSAPADAEVFVSYAGDRYEEQPRWRTVLGYYWTRLNRVVGRFLVQPTVFGIVAGPGCRAGDKDWLGNLTLS